MGIISRPRSNPAMFRALARYCRQRDIGAAPEDSLRETIAPTGLTSRAGGGEESASGEGTVWRDSIELALELGIVERRDGDLVFDQRVMTELAADDVPSFRRALRRIVLAPEHNDGLWDSDGGEGWSSLGAREFSRIAVWHLETPPGTLSTETAYDAARRSVEGPAKLVENVEQWRVFVRWAEALGLISRVDSFPLPDPTIAVGEELAEVFSGQDELPALKVRDGLAHSVPVLRHGAYARGLDDFLLEKPRRLEAEAGPALAFALARLERRRLISFDRRSDADQLVLSDPHSSENPTHVLWRGSK
jgi:hypothetical protein